MNIDDKIEEWHTGNSDKPLHEFLGMTWGEYDLWLRTGELSEHLKTLYYD